MWEQDDWNSNEDLTLCQAQSWASDHRERSGATAPRQRRKYSAYPVGCEPDKKEAHDEQTEGGRSRDAKRRSAVRALEGVRRRRGWKAALGRFIAACRSREGGAGRTPPSPPRAAAHPGYRKASSCPPIPENSPPPMPLPVPLWSITRALSKRFTGPSIPPSLPNHQQDSPQESCKSTLSASLQSRSTSTNSSIASSPVDQESHPHQPDSLSAPNHHPDQRPAPVLIPPLDPVFEPFQFSPTDLIEELR